MIEKMMVYALGRGLEFYDAPAVRAITREAARTNHRFSSLAPGTVFRERATAFDLHATKFVNIGRTKLRVMVDLFNAFNNNAPTREDYVLTVTGADNYLRPGTIMPGRLVKFGAQLDF